MSGAARSSSAYSTMTAHLDAPYRSPTVRPFIRDVQITGDLAGNGVVYLAGMDEGGGGFPHNNINKIFKSTDGGTTWTNTYSGPAFPGPGVTAVGYFRLHVSR